jgi:ubiquinone/menaquinone biosynthesis C-methylase UbiE
MFRVDHEAMEDAEYLQRWHDRHPGATAAVMVSLTDELGRNSYELLAQVIHGTEEPIKVEPILDLACGDGCLLELLRPRHACLGVDWNTAELNSAIVRLGKDAPVARADAARLPIATSGLGAVLCHYALMLLQPLEDVLEELSRVLRPGGLLAVVLPAAPLDETPSPISAFRAAWNEASDNCPVTIPRIQDDRALQTESLARLLAKAGFVSIVTQPLSASKAMTVDEIIELLLLTYLPDLLPPAGLGTLTRRLKHELNNLDGGTGAITFVAQSDLVTARRA